MKTIRFLAILTGLLAPTAILRAQSFTYTVENSKTTITGFSAEPSGAVIVPSTLGGYTVTEIGRAAFKDRTGITSIGFATGASVTKLGAMAFQGCTALQNITLPSGTTTLPAGLLHGCASLTSVTIPGTVTTIGPLAFADCESLASITLPSSLVSLGESALSECRALASLTIPVGVTTIPSGLCSQCRSLASITFAGSATNIGSDAFHNCMALTAFSLPDTVTTVGDGAFSGCSGLVNLGIGTSLGTLGELALQGCDTLAAISVANGNTTFSSAGGVLFNAAQTSLLMCPPAKSGTYSIPSSVTSLGEAAFAHCKNLTSITLPGTLSDIPNDAFYYAVALTTPPITGAVTSIGAWAYAGLKQPTGMTIPSSVVTIGVDAFHSDSALAWVVFNGNAPTTVGEEAFDSAADGFTVFFYKSSTGFTAPTWMGYASQELGIDSALVAWLTDQGRSPGADLLSDANNDGVDLLTAYALGLDPDLNLSGSLPHPVLANGTLSLTFTGNRSGIVYGAETSGDLETWSGGGVTLSAPDSNGQRTASIPVTSGESGFLRLVFATQ